ncbi:MAG: hypothetical protein EOQ89_03660 [Mesorhizobium sp.]|nr:MAG: hypothetical protein EOQ89_03660 [Mesorhizobium sp.]
MQTVIQAISKPQPSAEEAIRFALECLEPFEIHEFLTEWHQGKSLQSWVLAYRQDREDVG